MRGGGISEVGKSGGDKEGMVGEGMECWEGKEVLIFKKKSKERWF